MRFINRKTLALAGAAAALIAVGSTGTAVAGSLIDSRQIADGSIRVKDLTPRAVTKFTAQTGGVDGVGWRCRRQDGVDGKDGKDGGATARTARTASSGLDVRHRASTTMATTNDGAIALGGLQEREPTTRTTGGVQVLGLDAAPTAATPRVLVLPRPMDWHDQHADGRPPDGWIVQCGGNAGPSQQAPEKVKVWRSA